MYVCCTPVAVDALSGSSDLSCWVMGVGGRLGPARVRVLIEDQILGDLQSGAELVEMPRNWCKGSRKTVSGVLGAVATQLWSLAHVS